MCGFLIVAKPSIIFAVCIYFISLEHRVILRLYEYLTFYLICHAIKRFVVLSPANRQAIGLNCSRYNEEISTLHWMVNEVVGSLR